MMIHLLWQKMPFALHWNLHCFRCCWSTCCWFVAGQVFPSFFFGANETGPEPVSELALIAKHSFAGWGWQQDVDVTPTSDDGHYYNEETALAQAATRLASYLEFSGNPKKTEAIFVYRHSQMALSWYTVQRAAYNNSANDEFWMRGPDGKVCVDKNRGGPAWNLCVFLC